MSLTNAHPDPLAKVLAQAQSPSPSSSPNSSSVQTRSVNPTASVGLAADEPAPDLRTSLEPSQAIWNANIAALERSNPWLAKLLRETQASQACAFFQTPQGVVGATLDGRQLASKRRPLDEAKTFADQLEVLDNGCAVVLGFGLGYHTRALFERTKEHCAQIIYEPDVALFRAVLERIDHSAWLNTPGVRIFTDADNGAAIAAYTRGIESFICVGVSVMPHAGSATRLGEGAKTFTSTFAQQLSSIRTVVATTMVHSEVTQRNVLMNMEHYVRWPGINELHNLCAGSPAVVVAAGPSLERNLHLLEDPRVRERCLIVAVQTVLKPLLERGIKPHFVTALDYHEISARFYEGLTAEDVAGITLVAEPKANPAILDAFPGQIRLARDSFADEVLGELAPKNMHIEPGSTVAQLCFNLARFMGCDPVMLIGQDLGFTDGQYYAKGAQIHNVWDTELNAFNTLEMMEWERIVRHREQLRKVPDIHGGTIFTDEQMATYLSQFERMFLADTEQGLTVIDASEGGTLKKNTTVMTLEAALEKHAGHHAPKLPAIPGAARQDDASHIASVRERVQRVRTDVRSVARGARDTAELLTKVKRYQADVPKANKLIGQIDGIRDRVTSLQPAYSLVMKINQLGGFKRFKVDRTNALQEGLSAFEKQTQALDRDQLNMSWIGDYADVLDELLQITDASFDGGPKKTSDNGSSASALEDEDAELQVVQTAAVVRMPANRPIADETINTTLLERTLERLALCENLERVVVTCEAGDAVGEQIARQSVQGIASTNVQVCTVEPAPEQADRSVRAARAFAHATWRAGIAGLTAFDETFLPMQLAPLLTEQELKSVVVLGHDWCAVDPQLTDALIDRYREMPDNLGFTFTQAPAGLVPMLMTAQTVNDLAKTASSDLPFGAAAAHTRYVPVLARADLIAKAPCVPVPTTLRDAGVRCVADTSKRASQLLAHDVLAQAEDICIDEQTNWLDDTVPPRHITLELNTNRHWGGERARLLGLQDCPIREAMSTDRAKRLLDELQAYATDATVTFWGVGDPVTHDDFFAIAAHAQQLGFGAVHVRTDGVHDDFEPKELAQRVIEAGIDIVSVDLLGNDVVFHEFMTGTKHFPQAQAFVHHVVALREKAQGRPSPWVVPRMLRCDMAQEHVEHFYDRWIMQTGAAIIDQQWRDVEGERIVPLGKPKGATMRDASSRLFVLCNGSVIADERDLLCAHPVANVNEGAGEAWSSLMRVRREALANAGGVDAVPQHTPAALWTGW